MKKTIFFLSLIVFSCQKTDNDPKNIQSLEKTIAYNAIDNVDPNLLSLDIYYNNQLNQKKPVVVYVHGGGWSIGNKSQKLNNKINFCKENDYILVSVNYRLSPYPFDIIDTTRIKYPIHNIDIADAIKWVHNHINEYGGDQQKIALIGHSAGAHLVALTGTNKSFLENVGLSLENIKGVAVIDTKGYDVHEQIINGSNKTMYINAFGTNFTLNQEASPIFNLFKDQNYPKFLIAKRGNTDRLAAQVEFIQALKDHNIYVEEVLCTEYSHTEINNAIGEKKELIITPALKDFFENCFIK